MQVCRHYDSVKNWSVSSPTDGLLPEMVLEKCSVLSFLSLIACYRSIAFQGNFTLLLSGLSTSVGENNGAADRDLGEYSCCWHKDQYAVKDNVLSQDVCKVVEVGR